LAAAGGGIGTGGGASVAVAGAARPRFGGVVLGLAKGGGRLMPEGHTLHRLARRQRRDLVGHTVAASSPQGRFAGGAALVDGRPSTGVEALGKHLFHRFEDLTVHVHLGLFGRFRRVSGDDPPPPSEHTRWILATDAVAWRLSGPTACEVIDPDAESALRGRIGPDPLAGDDPGPFFDRVARTRRPIGRVLADQAVVAGIGNVYRAEILFLAGVDPRRPAGELSEAEVEAIWGITAEQLAAGERSGRIVTVDPADVDAPSRSTVPKGERVYAYKRDGLPCRRCGTPIVSEDAGGRPIWWCPTCQG
jgi:endonuclease-8